MRKTMLVAGFALLAWTAPAAADTAKDIAAIEQRWGEAFLKGDRAFLESLLAPEFKLMRAEGGNTVFTPRAQWFATLDRYTFHRFDVHTVDVVDAGDTAVATIAGRWKISVAGRGERDEYFIVSDTFVRRNGAWQVLYRHSTPNSLPHPSTGQERGH